MYSYVFIRLVSVEYPPILRLKKSCTLLALPHHPISIVLPAMRIGC